MCLVSHLASSLLDELGSVKPHGPLVSISKKQTTQTNKATTTKPNHQKDGNQEGKMEKEQVKRSVALMNSLSSQMQSCHQAGALAILNQRCLLYYVILNCKAL